MSVFVTTRIKILLRGVCGGMYEFSLPNSLVVFQTFLLRIVISCIWQGWLIKRYTHTQEHKLTVPFTLNTHILFVLWSVVSLKLLHSYSSLCDGTWHRYTIKSNYNICLSLAVSLILKLEINPETGQQWKMHTHTHTHNLKPLILSHTSLNPCQIMNEPLTNPVISPSRLSLWKSAICKETFGEPLCPYSFFDAVFESSRLCVEFWI